MDSSTLYIRQTRFQFQGCLAVFFFFFRQKLPIVHAGGVGTDQTQHSAALDLGLHCLTTSALRDARHYRVNYRIRPGYPDAFWHILMCITFL